MQTERRYIYDGENKTLVKHINPYLLDLPNIYVKKVRNSLFYLPKMDNGNKPSDGKNLILSYDEGYKLAKDYPKAEEFIKRYMGADELTKDTYRYCLWIDKDNLIKALKIPPIEERLENVKRCRLKGGEASRKKANLPYEFIYESVPYDYRNAFLIPAIATDSRMYIPVRWVDNTVIPSNKNFVIYNPPQYLFSILVSKIHFLWISTVCGGHFDSPSYSNTMGYNTFPVPYLSKPKKQALYHSAWKIQKIRANHFPATLADLYDPKKMPLDLKQTHEENDALLESFYKEKPFEDDTERLSFLFRMYTRKKEEEESAKK